MPSRGITPPGSPRDHRWAGEGSVGCRELLALLSDYLEEELAEDLCRQVGAHLEGCPPCAAFVRTFARTTQMLKQLRAPTLPQTVAAEVHRLILQRTRHLA